MAGLICKQIDKQDIKYIVFNIYSLNALRSFHQDAVTNFNTTVALRDASANIHIRMAEISGKD
jgi:hypothetical protein